MDPVEDSSETVEWTYSTAIDPGLTRRMAGAFFRFRAPRLPANYLGFGLPILVILTAVALQLPIGAAIGILVLLYRVWTLHRGFEASIRLLYPGAREGSVIRTAFHDTGFDVDLPQSRLRQTYDVYSEIVRRGEFVFLRYRGSGQWTVLPRVVMPEIELGRFSLS